MNSIDKLFATGVFSKLTELAQYDLKEAGKCLALNRNTASAFHTLRATEECLKQFCFCSIKQKRLKKPMWASMIEALRKKETNQPSPVILDTFDMIRRHYRNPTQHPEKIYDEEAQDLFNLCITVINQVHK